MFDNQSMYSKYSLGNVDFQGNRSQFPQAMFNGQYPQVNGPGFENFSQFGQTQGAQQYMQGNAPPDQNMQNMQNYAVANMGNNPNFMMGQGQGNVAYGQMHGNYGGFPASGKNSMARFGGDATSMVSRRAPEGYPPDLAENASMSGYGQPQAMYDMYPNFLQTGPSMAPQEDDNINLLRFQSKQSMMSNTDDAFGLTRGDSKDFIRQDTNELARQVTNDITRQESRSRLNNKKRIKKEGKGK